METLDPNTYQQTIPQAFLAAMKHKGRKTEILEDAERTKLTYDRILLGGIILGKKLAVGAEKGERVGVLLPSVNGAVVTLFGLWFRGLVPVILNFTAGLRNLKSACATAQVRTIITSRRFIDMGKLEDLLAGLEEDHRIIFLEDVRKSIKGGDKIGGLIASKFARGAVNKGNIKPSDPAVILFTSGSEGTPKGVVLSHANLVANIRQIQAFAPSIIGAADTVLFNPLPIFHSFGLTTGPLLGLLAGLRTFIYPSPLHFKQIPKLVGETKATLLVATDTFLMGYARAAEPGELQTLRHIVAGAERVKDETRKTFQAFGTTIYEGYGVTETAPVLSVNLPHDNVDGTVGKMLPGIEHRIDPVEGIAEGGRLVVRGPNIMIGYMFADRPGVIVPPQGGWHDTGDIVDVSGEGRITIKGRAKRFAKLGGEMVSLGAVEAVVSSLWPGFTHVCVALPDPKKGEQVVLVTDKQDADRVALQPFFRKQNVPELWVPRSVLVVDQVPILGSGKLDYGGTLELVKSRRGLF
jgi:acyl-[acyl-carrier-protein]-phospholipid O-acyltransferase / long-chain-fatty-acid--[acyl-carrier-protein] ligase